MLLRKKRKVFSLASILAVLCLAPVMAQTKLTLTDAEKEMQKNNLSLLAEKYNLTGAKAALIQAKIWEQPYVSGELNVVNPQKNRYLDAGAQGQKAIAISQLIYLGGKKKNEIDFAKKNVELAELEFEQLLRNLKYQLGVTFYGVYFDRQKLLSLEAQIAILDTLLKNYNIQAEKGNIPLREVVRLQSLVLNLKNDRNTLLKYETEAMENLSLLTGVKDNIVPDVNEQELLKRYQKNKVPKDSLRMVALEKNLDFLYSIKAVESQTQYLKWQKSLARPNLTAGLSYDQRGGAFQNQVNLTLGIPLPIWNKNKGNIQVAEAELSRINLNKDYKKLEIELRVETLWNLYIQQLTNLNNLNENTSSNMEQVYNGTLNNFRKRNISMLEFTDFMESYNQASILINELKKSLIVSGINLSYITNREIF